MGIYQECVLKDSRVGEGLWVEWSGEGFVPFRPSSIMFYTFEHVDVEIDVVKRALASSLQRDGIAISLGEGYRLADAGLVTHGFCGYIDGEIFLTVCNEFGETDSGDVVDEILEITWVELNG
jgi:hypothetical protein